MRWSVESRLPFLTTEMAEFLLSLPEEFLLSPRGVTKHIFREAMRGIVPDQILDRHDKVGFSTPERDWLRQISPQLISRLNELQSTPLLKADAALAEFKDIVLGSKEFSWRAWRIANYSIWWRLVFRPENSRDERERLGQDAVHSPVRSGP